jgi:hypothetical protein
MPYTWDTVITRHDHRGTTRGDTPYPWDTVIVAAGSC